MINLFYLNQIQHYYFKIKFQLKYSFSHNLNFMPNYNNFKLILIISFYLKKI